MSMLFKKLTLWIAGFFLMITIQVEAAPIVEIKTSQGPIIVELYSDKAPNTVANFLQYVKDGFYNGTIFHRVIPNFMAQGGGFDFFANRVKEMAGLDHTKSNSLEIIDGKLTGNILGPIVDAQAKADSLLALRDELGLKPNQVIAIGDGANDLKMMAAAAAGIAYHAKPIVQQQASYTLNFTGLDGAIHLFDTGL